MLTRAKKVVYQVQADPLPEDDVFGHDVGLHLALHLDVEDLEGLLRLQGDHLRGRVHDGRVGGDGPPDGVHGVGHVDDDNLVVLSDLLADADELVRLHGEGVEAHVGRADPDIGELAKRQSDVTILTTTFGADILTKGKRIGDLYGYRKIARRSV